MQRTWARSGLTGQEGGTSRNDSMAEGRSGTTARLSWELGGHRAQPGWPPPDSKAARRVTMRSLHFGVRRRLRRSSRFGTAQASVDPVGRVRSGRVSGLNQCLGLDRGRGTATRLRSNPPSSGTTTPTRSSVSSGSPGRVAHDGPSGARGSDGLPTERTTRSSPRSSRSVLRLRWTCARGERMARRGSAPRCPCP